MRNEVKRTANCSSAHSAFRVPNSAFSIVIPSHSRPDLLRLCLASVMRFAPRGTEIIVVDDGSRGAVVSRTAAEFAGVKVVRRARAGGFCVAANAGIAVASAPVVELLNDDAEVTEGWADAALWWFKNERIAAVAPLVLQNDPARRARGLPPLIDSAGDEYDPGGFARKRGHGQVWIEDGEKETVYGQQWTEDREKETVFGLRPEGALDNSPVRKHWVCAQSIKAPKGRHMGALVPPLRGFIHGWTQPSAYALGYYPTPLRGEDQIQPTAANPLHTAHCVTGASACAAFYRRGALLHAGGFPEHFGAYFEDVDLSFRLRRLGFEIVHDPASVVWHRVSSSYGKTPSRRTLERQSCNEERVFWRNVRGRQLVKCLPRHAAVLAGKALRRWQEGTLLPWLMGRLRAMT